MACLEDPVCSCQQKPCFELFFDNKTLIEVDSCFVWHDNHSLAVSAIGLGILVKILIVVSGAAQLRGNFSTPSSHNWSYPTRSKNFVGSWFFEEINLQFAFVGIDDTMINNCRLDHMDVSKKMFLLEDPPAIFFHRRTSSRSGYHNHAGPPAWVDEDITGKVWGIFGGSKLRRNSWPFILFHDTSVSKVEIHQNFTSHLGPTKFQLPPRRRMPRRERSWDRRSPSGVAANKAKERISNPNDPIHNTTLKGLVSIEQIMFHLGPWISWKGSCQGSNTFTQPNFNRVNLYNAYTVCRIMTAKRPDYRRYACGSAHVASPPQSAW